jgi:hypothetical protein
MQTNPCLFCLEADAAHPLPAQLCDTCFAEAAGSIDDSEARRLADEGVYADEMTAFAHLVATRIDSAINGETHLDGEVIVYAPRAPAAHLSAMWAGASAGPGFPMLDGGCQ